MVLIAHGIWRWFVLAALASALVASLASRAGLPVRNARVRTIAAAAVDGQLALGLALLAVSPLLRSGGSERRFFAFVHVPAMIAVVAFFHAGNVVAARTSLPYRRGISIAFFAAALAIALLATPWFRPLVRSISGPSFS